jgi:PilZ domain
MTMQTGRTERRMATNTVASVEAADEPAFKETVVFVNISEHGACFISRRRLLAGKRVIVSDSLVNFRALAEVVYCAPHSPRRFSVGVKFN